MDMKFFEHFDELLPLLSSRLPKQQGTLNEGPLGAMVVIYGDYGLSVAYAALFAPKIELTQNCPVVFFGPDEFVARRCLSCGPSTPSGCGQSDSRVLQSPW